MTEWILIALAVLFVMEKVQATGGGGGGAPGTTNPTGSGGGEVPAGGGAPGTTNPCPEGFFPNLVDGVTLCVKANPGGGWTPITQDQCTPPSGHWNATTQTCAWLNSTSFAGLGNSPWST